MKLKHQIVLVLIAVIAIFAFLPKADVMKDTSGKILNTNVEILYPKVKESFDEAELKFLPKVEKDEVAGPDKDPAKCVCKGTGKITQGDGHVTNCPFHSKVNRQDVSYKKYNNSTQNIERQVIIFGAEWCAPCRNIKENVLPELTKMGIDVSDGAYSQFRTVDIDKNRQFYDGIKGNTNSIPLFVEIINNTVVSREARSLTLEEILERYTEK